MNILTGTGGASAHSNLLIDPAYLNVYTNQLQNVATVNQEGAAYSAALVPFFGIPNVEGVQSVAESARTFDHRQYYSAFAGKSTLLPNIIIGLAINRQEWLYSAPDGFPVVITEDLHYEWSTIIYEEGILHPTPEEGSPRVLSSKVHKGQLTMTRKSIGIQNECTFMTTAIGLQSYYRQVQQVEVATAITFAMDALFTFYSIRDTDVRRLDSTVWYDLTEEGLIKKQAENFAIGQKISGGLIKQISDYKGYLTERGRAPQFMAFPQGIQALLRGALNSDELDYSKVGPVAETRRQMDYRNMTTFMGMRLHLNRTYKDFTSGQIPIDIGVRNRVWGEHAIMPALKPNHYSYWAEDSDYCSDQRAVKIPEYRRDNWAEIRLQDMVDLLEIFDSEGFVRNTKQRVRISAQNPDNFIGTRVGDAGDDVMQLFETQGWHGVEMASKLGEMAEEFMPDDNLALIAYQLVRKRLVGNFYNTCVKIGNAVNAQNPLDKANLVILGQQFAEKYNRDPNDINNRKRVKGGQDVIPLPSHYRGLLKPLNAQQVPVVSSSSSFNMERVHANNMENLGESQREVYHSFLQQLSAEEQPLFVNKVQQSLLNNDLQTSVFEPIATLGNKNTKPSQRQQLRVGLLAPISALSESSAAAAAVDLTGATTYELVNADKYNENEIEDLKAGGARLFHFDPVKFEAIESPVAINSKIQNSKDAINFINYHLTPVSERSALMHDSLSKKIQGLKPIANERRDIANAIRQTTAHAFATGAGKDLPEFARRLALLGNAIQKLTDKTGYDQDDLTVAYLVVMFAQLHRETFNFLVAMDIHFPFTIMIVRPWVVGHTYSGIIGTGGIELGATLVKNPDVMKSSTASNKTMITNLTIWHKCAKFNPDLVCIMDDLVLKSYRGGGTTKPLTLAHIREIRAQGWKVPGGDVRGSIYPLLVATADGSPLPHLCHIFGWYYSGKKLVRHYYTAENGYQALMADIPALPHAMHPTDIPFAHWTFQVTQLLYNPHDKKWNAVIFSGINHLGQNFYAGAVKHLHTHQLLLKDIGLEDTTKYVDFYTL